MHEKAPWAEVRARYESGGCSYRSLAEEYGVSRQTVAAHAGKEGWHGEKRWYKARARGSRQCLRETATGLLAMTKRAAKRAESGEVDIRELKELAGILQTLAGLERTLNGGPQENGEKDTTLRVIMGEDVEALSR